MTARRSDPASTKGWRRWASKRRGVALAVLLVGALAADHASGVLLWLSFGAAAVGLLGVLLPPDPSGPTRRLESSRFAAMALPLASVFVALALFEALLWALERAAAQPLPTFTADSAAEVPLAPELPAEIRTKIERMQSALIMPSSWQKRDVDKVPGVDPYLWHTAYHAIDANGMRRREPFPPRDPTRFRIMVMGDSLTYGEGIDAFWTYPAQLERSLAVDFRVEVLNLGVKGHASEDVLNVVRRFLPELEPDLVVYGVCLNDFLDAGAAQPVHYVVPLPNGLKKTLRRRTRVGRLVEERYDALLRRLGLRPDFYSELLAGLDAYERRFGRDVAALNAFVVAHGLPAVVAMVLDQAPRWVGPGRRLALVAEAKLLAAGADVVDSTPFYRHFDGRDFRVSRWEGHPNEEAHAIWADMLARSIRELDQIAPFRRPAASPGAKRS